jgi:hypothetical protein
LTSTPALRGSPTLVNVLGSPSTSDDPSTVSVTSLGA